MVAATALLILEILTTTLPDGVAGKKYEFRLQAQGGQRPYVWSVAEGALPQGLKLVPATGEISGWPARSGEAKFTVEIKDAGGESYRMALRLMIWQPVRLLTQALPSGFGGTPYRTELRAVGGMMPYRWELMGGVLPDGVQLDRNGLLFGTAVTGGAYEFSVRLTDSAKPPQSELYNFALRLVSPLSVVWKEAPKVTGGGIFGSLLATNGTRDNFDLTVIIVAVNEIGKAFTLGHHHFLLASGTSTQELRFGFTLPRGRYTVHADAVGEVASKHQIFRARLQQDAPAPVE